MVPALRSFAVYGHDVVSRLQFGFVAVAAYTGTWSNQLVLFQWFAKDSGGARGPGGGVRRCGRRRSAPGRTRGASAECTAGVWTNIIQH